MSQRSGFKSWQVWQSLTAMIFSTSICNSNHNKYVRYRKNLASLERVSSENKGKQPKGEEKVQQTNKKTGTKQIKNVQRKRKCSRSSRLRPPREFETVAVTNFYHMVKQERVVDYESLRKLLVIGKERCS